MPGKGLDVGSTKKNKVQIYLDQPIGDRSLSDSKVNPGCVVLVTLFRANYGPWTKSIQLPVFLSSFVQGHLSGLVG